MIPFERRDPFPLLTSNQLSVSEKSLHSAAVDLFLGLRVNDIEAKLDRTGSRRPAPQTSGDKQNLWFGLAPQDLLTPYLEIREVLHALNPTPGEVVVDLGAAYGRMGFVIERHFQGVRFEGYEFVGERVDEGRRCLEKFGALKSNLHHADLTSKSFKIPKANYYFIYDFGTDSAIEAILIQLGRIALTSGPFKLIARGRRTQYAIADSHRSHCRWLKAEANSGMKSYTIYDSMVESSMYAG
ncbi:MAG: hypothetical protein V4692_15845, partial [Bdellovibrionota bacterium]